MFTEQITWLYVADLDASRRFYQQGLGLEVTLEQASCCILRGTDTAFRLTPATRDPPGSCCAS